MYVSDWMTKKVFTVSADDFLSDAIALMKEKNIKHLPIMKNDRLKGIVSDRDIKEYTPSKATCLDVYELHYLLANTKIKDVMRTKVITTTPGAPIEEAAMTMLDQNTGCLPVLDNGNLVGIISDKDIFRALVDITGVRHGGHRVCVTIEDRAGSIREVADIIRRHHFRLQGILTGIDNQTWNPETDPHIAANYSATDLSGKRRCKAALQQSYDLPVQAQIPVFGMSARLVEQKGLDLVLGGDLLHSVDAQFIFLGSGEHRYHEALANLAAAAPERVVAEFAFTDRQEHLLLAGADLLLMPSLYEPCGLTQMRAQRYGAVPIVRAVGGLQDSVQDDVTGFLFDEYAPAALESTVRRVLQRFEDREAWRALIRRAMGARFGWDESTLQYSAAYRRALNTRARG